MLLRALFLISLYVAAAAAAPLPSVAFHYGSPVPVDDLRGFDWAVVDPDAAPSPPAAGSPAAGKPRPEWFAYVSVGEVSPSRAYFKEMPEAWLKGENAGWGSRVIDQTAAGWPQFFVERIVGPLWQAGYRGFFLDTLDSWQLIAKDDAGRGRQRQALVELIRLLKRRYPEARLIFNRGFEILPDTHALAVAVAAESLFESWNAGAKRYEPVKEADRAWLLGQLGTVKDRYRKPVIAIDYVPAEQPEKQRDTARRIAALGFIPWVSVPSLDRIGAGLRETRPKRLMMLYDGLDAPQLVFHNLHRFAAMPAAWLGYRLDYFDIRRDALPAADASDRYAGAVLWSNSQKPDPRFEAWLIDALERRLPLAILGGTGVPVGARLAGLLGWSIEEDRPPYAVEAQTPLIGFETRVRLPAQLDYTPRLNRGEAQLTLKNAAGAAIHPVAFTDWGGYALSPFDVAQLTEDEQRWVIDPFAFLRRALRLEDRPAADATTLNGRRLLLVHVDGDGFASRAEFGARRFAGEELLDWLQRYPLPSTVSVIEGEVGPQGLYPQLSPVLEPVARRIFALPQVEIASHSYSHPFRWQAFSGDGSAAEGANLPIPGYRFSLEREILGSVDYIDRRLAPPGKKTLVFLWSGDCNPGPEALRLAQGAGLLTMNGGETVISRKRPSLTHVAPPGLWKDGLYQVYAPNQNENVYTNLWRGPFYGYRDAIETFVMTDSPRRLKPVDIYYHVYSLTKPASREALDAVYRWALGQTLFPVYASEYIRMAEERNHAAIEETDGRWRLRLGERLRTVRIPQRMGYPDLAASRNVAGYRDHNEDRYISLSDGEAELVLSPTPPAGPYLDNSNGRITAWQRTANGLRFGLAAWRPLELTLGNAARCELRQGAQRLNGRIEGHRLTVKLNRNVADAFELSCPA